MGWRLHWYRGTLRGVLTLLGTALCLSFARAGDYHAGNTLICSDCHTMHYSVSHSYTGGSPPVMGGNGPYEMLLKNEITALCLSCHDGQTFAPDVYGANTNNYVREAGAITTGSSPYETWKGHTLGFVTCTSCHDPHGEPAGQYRNLQIRPGSATGNRPVTYAIGTNDLTKDIFERDATLGQIAIHYSYTNVDLNEPDTHNSAIGKWCSSCHTNFHGTSTSSNMRLQSAPADTGWLRHPTADAYIGELTDPEHSSLAVFNDLTKPNRVKVMSPTGVWSQPYPSGVTPTCLSCHKAHGSQNPFGLIYMSGTGQITESGDTNGTTLQHLCRQCHTE